MREDDQGSTTRQPSRGGTVSFRSDVPRTPCYSDNLLSHLTTRSDYQPPTAICGTINPASSSVGIRRAGVQ